MSDTVFEAGERLPVFAARPSWGGVRVGRVVATVLRLVVGLGLVAGAAFFIALGLEHLPRAAPEPAVRPVPAWREIVKPVQIYSLEAPAFSGAPVTYAAKRHTVGGGREDVLQLGVFDGARPAMRMRLFRRGAEPAVPLPLYAALAHEAAQVGLGIERSGLPTLVPTRFGKFEYEQVALAPEKGDPLSCGGFRLILEQPALTVAGLACGNRTAPLGVTEVGCLIERLDVAAARDDAELIDFFARSELHRNAACAGMRLGPDGLHAAWLDEKPEPNPVSRVVARDDKPATSRKRLRRR